MRWYVLIYDYVPDYVERRATVREEHLALARAANERGELVLGGAYGDTPAQGVLVWHTPDEKTVEAFVERDPYVRSGVVASWRIRPWNVVIGGKP